MNSVPKASSFINNFSLITFVEGSEILGQLKKNSSTKKKSFQSTRKTNPNLQLYALSRGSIEITWSYPKCKIKLNLFIRIQNPITRNNKY